MFLTKLVLTAMRMKQRVLGSKLFWVAAACVLAFDLLATQAHAGGYYYTGSAPRYYYYNGRWYFC